MVYWKDFKFIYSVQQTKAKSRLRFMFLLGMCPFRGRYFLSFAFGKAALFFLLCVNWTFEQLTSVPRYHAWPHLCQYLSACQQHVCNPGPKEWGLNFCFLPNFICQSGIERCYSLHQSEESGRPWLKHGCLVKIKKPVGHGRCEIVVLDEKLRENRD